MSKAIHPGYEVFRVTVPEDPARVIPGISHEYLARFLMATTHAIIARTTSIEDLADSAVHAYLHDYLSGTPSPRALQSTLPEIGGPLIERNILPIDAHQRVYIPRWPNVLGDTEVRVCLLEIRAGLSDEQLQAHAPEPQRLHNPNQLTFSIDDQAA